MFKEKESQWFFFSFKGVIMCFLKLFFWFVLCQSVICFAVLYQRVLLCKSVILCLFSCTQICTTFTIRLFKFTKKHANLVVQKTKCLQLFTVWTSLGAEVEFSINNGWCLAQRNKINVVPWLISAAELDAATLVSKPLNVHSRQMWYHWKAENLPFTGHLK